MSEDSSQVVRRPAEEAPSPLDAEEVRRRSARVRRWQNLGALVALALAVALFVLPLLVLDPGESDGPTKRGRAATPEPTGQPRTSWETAIDADFPLDLALPVPARGQQPTPSATAPGADLADWDLCGARGLGEGVESRLGVRSRGDARELVTLEDDAAAGELVGRISAAADGCDSVTVADRDLGDESLDLAGPRTLSQLVRVGNAVLVLERTGTWSSAEAAAVGLDQMAAVAAPLADEMCGYALHPC